MGLQETHHHGAGFQLADLFEAERGDGQDNVGLRENGSRTTGPFPFLVERVRELGANASPRLPAPTRTPAAVNLSTTSGTRLTRVSPGALSFSAPIVMGI
jgi:hypothetical protein